MKKRVLIVSYYWPPSGGISVLRSLKIAKQLNRLGWEVVVATVTNAQYSIIDEDNFQHVSSDIEVLRFKSFEPFNLYKKITGTDRKDTLSNVLTANSEKRGFFHKLSVFIRANFFIPDARMFWIRPAVKGLKRYLKAHPVDVVFSDGPPHTNTIIAAKLSRKLTIPWLMDWQDPWTQADYYADFNIGHWSDKKHRRLEQFCIEQASKITIVSPSWKNDVEQLGAKNVSVIEWGYDDDDFKGIEKPLDEKYLITHLGLLGADRNPSVFLHVVAELVQELEGFYDNTRIEFFGTVGVEVKLLVKHLKLEKVVIIGGNLQRSEALSKMSASHIQLLLLNKAPNAMGRIPGKLFENLRIGRPILCLGPEGSDVSKILGKTESGLSLTYDDRMGMKKYLKKGFENYQKGYYDFKRGDISQYSIENLFGKLAGHLEKLVKTP